MRRSFSLLRCFSVLMLAEMPMLAQVQQAVGPRCLQPPGPACVAPRHPTFKQSI